ncbi:major facilitator superfamily domain-containing protein [Lyophyllum atratum]|nr:major facilitator superfamily domain-containing protein [Lyophyllum atratum]
MSTEVPSEITPLLVADPDLKHELVYKRFSPRRKLVVLILISWCGLIPMFISGSFLPSIPDIAKDLNTTGPIISLAVSLSMFASSLGGLSGAGYSTYCSLADGRRPVYIFLLPLCCIGTFGVALSKTVPQLMVWRFIQVFGAAPAMTVGAGTIGDLYALEERGQAMGIYFAACFLGPALAPSIGGFAAQYASWRVMQAAIGAVGCVMLICMVLFFPETSHPGKRGIDRIPEGSRRLVFVNPLKPVALWRSPILVAVAFSAFTVLLSNFVLLVPLAYTIGVRYNITNTALIGACYLPAGIGSMIGAPLAGRMSDKVVIEWRRRRGGVWYPEDRLRGTFIGAFFLVPFSVLCSGLLTQFVPGKVGLILNLICLFFNGLGCDIVLCPIGAYVVDIFRDQSAEAIAANVSFRGFAIAISISGLLPLIDVIGVGGTNALSAILAWIGGLVLWCTIRYGTQLRAWVDVGYSTADTN